MKPESVRRTSALELYSLGAVIKTKEPGVDEIEVTPIEDFAFEDGYLAEIKKKHKVTIPDSIQRTKKADVDSTVALKAKWIPFGHSNRISAPDVVKNETVILFRFGSNDSYYWTSIFREPSLRRLEKVMYAWSNLKDGIGSKIFGRLTSYWVEVSTMDKWIWLKTNKNDGEAFAYDIKIDTKNGRVLMQDDSGQLIDFNSATGTLTASMHNKIVLIAPDVLVQASNSITFDSPIVTNTGNEVTVGSSTANPHYHYAP